MPLPALPPTRLPTPAEIAELTAFLPILYAPGFVPATWPESGQRPDGTIVLPVPRYPPQVNQFYRLASQEQWRDNEYLSHTPHLWVRDDAFIKQATLAQIKTMLTWCVRGERFCDGHFEVVIKDGTLRKLLERLLVLNETPS